MPVRFSGRGQDILTFPYGKLRNSPSLRKTSCPMDASFLRKWCPLQENHAMATPKIEYMSSSTAESRADKHSSIFGDICRPNS